MVTYREVEEAYTRYAEANKELLQARAGLVSALVMVGKQTLVDQEGVKKWLDETRKQQAEEETARETMNTAEAAFLTARQKLAKLLDEFSPARVMVSNPDGSQEIIHSICENGRLGVGCERQK